MMNVTYDIRNANQDDSAEIARIYNHYVILGGATFATQPLENSEISVMIDSLTDRECWYVAQRRKTSETSNLDQEPSARKSDTPTGGLLGWASARSFSDRFGYRLSCETAIYLSPDAVGCGVADQLQNHIHTHCRATGIHHLMAKITATNERSLQFHYRHGYTLVGIQNEVGHLDGQWQDVAILQKLLPLESVPHESVTRSDH